MEFLEGETLSRRLRRGPIPPLRPGRSPCQICAGVAEAHRKGVIHGDLKTANIILTTTLTAGPARLSPISDWRADR